MGREGVEWTGFAAADATGGASLFRPLPVSLSSSLTAAIFPPSFCSHVPVRVKFTCDPGGHGTLSALPSVTYPLRHLLTTGIWPDTRGELANALRQGSHETELIKYLIKSIWTHLSNIESTTRCHEKRSSSKGSGEYFVVYVEAATAE